MSRFIGNDRAIEALARAILSGEPRGDVECRGCERMLLREDFSPHPNTANRLCPLCKVCASLKSGRWHLLVRKPRGFTPKRGERTKHVNRVNALHGRARRLGGTLGVRGFLERKRRTQEAKSA